MALQGPPWRDFGPTAQLKEFRGRLLIRPTKRMARFLKRKNARGILAREDERGGRGRTERSEKRERERERRTWGGKEEEGRQAGVLRISQYRCGSARKS